MSTTEQRRRAPRSIRTRCARSTARSATSASAPTATTSTWRWSGNFAHYLEDPYVAPIEREPLPTRSTSSSSAAASAACWPAPACARPASTTSASSRRAATSAARGTGTATRARCATSSRTSTCRCSRRSATSRRRSTRTRRRSSPTARPSARHFDLYDDACFQTEVTELRWDDDAARAGSSRPTAATAMRARFVCMANGPLHRPKLPGIPGIETFEGHTFHTSRWDYDYTGGDSDGGPHRPRAASGSASSAPARPPCSASRTSARRPSTCTCSSARRRRSTCAPTARPIRSGRPACEPGWQQQRMDNFNTLVSGGFQDEDLVERRLDRHHRQAADHGAPASDADLSAEGVAGHAGAGRLREDGADPGPRRHHRAGPGRRPRR